MLSGDGEGASVPSHILETVGLVSLYEGGVCIAGVSLLGYFVLSGCKYLVPARGLLVIIWAGVGASTSSFFPKPGFMRGGTVVDLGFSLSR